MKRTHSVSGLVLAKATGTSIGIFLLLSAGFMAHWQFHWPVWGQILSWIVSLTGVFCGVIVFLIYFVLDDDGDAEDCLQNAVISEHAGLTVVAVAFALFALIEVVHIEAVGSFIAYFIFLAVWGLLIFGFGHSQIVKFEELVDREMRWK